MSYTLRDFGCYTAGGRIHRVVEGETFPIQVTRDSSYLYDPKGHFAVEHAYVQFFIPERRNNAPPVVLVHGGGTHGATWDTTPDGRPGWLHLLVGRGYEVHVVDAVERGRAGWMPGLWKGNPILRSMEEAWSLFRFGPPEGFSDRLPFPGQQFPIEHLERLARSFTPRWLSTSHLQIAALVAVLENTGPAILVTHSQGGEIGFDAQALRPDLVAAIIAVEPSAAPAEITTLAKCPTVLLVGDFLDIDDKIVARSELWRDTIDRGAALNQPNHLLDTRRDIAPGGSHMLMMDRHGEACLDGALEHLAL
jgi:pimeloyl-ACP methyl ester carboxylesterase